MFGHLLFARPSFLSGMSRSVDIGSTINCYNTAPTPEMADSLAILSDWLEIGRDIQKTAGDYGKEIPKSE